MQAEWSLGTNEVSLEINLASHIAEWHCFNAHTSLSSEQVLTLDDDAAWEWVIQELGRLGSTAE